MRLRCSTAVRRICRSTSSSKAHTPRHLPQSCYAPPIADDHSAFPSGLQQYTSKRPRLGRIVPMKAKKAAPPSLQGLQISRLSALREPGCSNRGYFLSRPTSHWCLQSTPTRNLDRPQLNPRRKRRRCAMRDARCAMRDARCAMRDAGSVRKYVNTHGVTRQRYSEKHAYYHP
jgi:hypothetical protein